MYHIVNPALALLDAEAAPLRLRHEVRLRNQLGDLFRQHYVPVLENAVVVFVRVVDIVVSHFFFGELLGV